MFRFKLNKTTGLNTTSVEVEASSDAIAAIGGVVRNVLGVLCVLYAPKMRLDRGHVAAALLDPENGPNA